MYLAIRNANPSMYVFTWLVTFMQDGYKSSSSFWQKHLFLFKHAVVNFISYDASIALASSLLAFLHVPVWVQPLGNIFREAVYHLISISPTAWCFSGWCYLRDFEVHGSNITTHHPITVSEVFSQIFVYLTYITLLILYVWIRCSIRFKVCKCMSIVHAFRISPLIARASISFACILERPYWSLKEFFWS